MALTPQEILNLTSRQFLLGNTSVEEQIGFISDQISDPFNSGSANYMKKLKTMVNPDRLDEICTDLLSELENQYPHLDLEISEIDQHLDEVFRTCYKFFVLNIKKLMYIFLREYIYTSKNRKMLVAEYLNMKLPNYPKEQYGKKDYYILITKLPAIIKDIQDDDIKLEKFIEYIERSGSSPMYLNSIKTYLDKGIIIDRGVVADIFKAFMKSEEYDPVLCKLQMAITENIINPYLEENGLSSLKIPPIDPVDEDAEDDDEEDNSDSDNED